MAAYNDSSRRKRGTATTDLNLVPFIDLFSVLVIFLVSTAVWDQLAAVPLSMGVEDKPAFAVPNDAAKVKKITSSYKLIVMKENVDIFDNGMIQRVPLVDIPDPNDSEKKIKDLSAISKFITKVRAESPDKKDMLILASDTSVYKDLVAIMDLCMEKQFSELVVSGLEQ